MDKNFDHFTSFLDREVELCDIHSDINRQVRQLESDDQSNDMHYIIKIRKDFQVNNFINLYKDVLKNDFSLKVFQNNPKNKRSFLKISELNRRKKHLIIISHNAIFELKESLDNAYKAILQQEKKILENWFILISQKWKSEKIKNKVSEQGLLINEFIESYNDSIYALRDISSNISCVKIEDFLKRIIKQEDEMVIFSKRIASHKKLENKLVASINATNKNIKAITNIISYKKSKEGD